MQGKLLRETDPALERSASITKRSLLSAQTNITHVTGPPKLSGEERVVPSNVSGIQQAEYAAQNITQKGCLQNLCSPEGGFGNRYSLLPTVDTEGCACADSQHFS